MKFSISFVISLVLIFQLNATILASPPKGGIGDGFIRSITQSPSKPKTTTTYYAKPLHPPMPWHAGPPKHKPQVYKVIIKDQPSGPPPKQEIYKIIRLPQHGGGGSVHKKTKSIKIIKLIRIKKPSGGHSAGKWSR